MDWLPLLAPFLSLRTTTKVQKHPKKPAQAGFFAFWRIVPAEPASELISSSGGFPLFLPLLQRVVVPRIIVIRKSEAR